VPDPELPQYPSSPQYPPPEYPAGTPQYPPPEYPAGTPQYPGYLPYPEYPRAGGPAPPPRPASVTNAVRLMYVGAALSAVNMVLGLTDQSAFKAAVRQARPSLTPSQVNTAANALFVSVVVAGIFGIALWLWMAWANGRGRKWARVTGTVFFGIDTLGLLGSVAQHEPALSLVFSAIVWLVGLGTVILLWRPESTGYFNAPKYT
jgi:hypothetical protein